MVKFVIKDLILQQHQAALHRLSEWFIKRLDWLVSDMLQTTTINNLVHILLPFIKLKVIYINSRTIQNGPLLFQSCQVNLIAFESQNLRTRKLNLRT